MSIMGTRVLRTEDPRLLSEGGVYVDDLRVPELTRAAFATFVRSPIAHALITGIDSSAAREQPGVVAVITAADLPTAEGPTAEPLLAAGRVRYVGEPVALVLTDDRYQGEDAAELVSVDYEHLPAVVGFDGALGGDSLLFPDAGTNVAVTTGDLEGDAAFEGCEVVVEQVITNQRLAPVPMEGRAVAAEWSDGKLTVWLSTQNAQISRFVLAGAFGLDPANIRVVAPDVGGGFGAKIGIDRDGLIVAWAAKHIGGALRWAESRSENLVAMTHG